jgi:flagellar capping protein FliD
LSAANSWPTPSKFALNAASSWVLLTELQARYTKQFNALDTLLAKLQSTSNYLTQQLGNLPGFK